MEISDKLKNQKGLTLIELACGITFVGILGTAIYLGISGNKFLKKYIAQPTIERADVIGNSKADLFIDQDGKRFYAEVDGKPISEYFKNKN
jgi:hypothetical protein